MNPLIQIFKGKIKCITKHDTWRGQKMTDDLVNHPPHYKYNDKGIECIEAIEGLHLHLKNTVDTYVDG